MKKSSVTSARLNEKKMKSKNSFFSTFQAEPALLLHMISTIITFVNVQDFIMEKVCSVNMEYSEDICTALTTAEGEEGSRAQYQENEVQVQKLMGKQMMVRTILENVFPLFLVILIGAWSDKYGRKLPMLFVIFAFILQNIALLFCVYLKSIGGWSVAIVTSLIPGLSGNNACFNMAIFSYIAEKSPPEERTARTGVAHSMLFLGLTIGLALGGALSGSTFGFGQIFTIGLILEIGVFIYVLFVVEDHPNQNSKPFLVMLREIFTVQHLRDAFTVVTKPRPGNTKTKLIILLASHFCAFAPIMGEMTVFFLFGRYMFNWYGAELGFFMTYKTVLGFLGNFITMGLLSQRLKLADPVIGICGCLSVLMASVYYSMVESSYFMFFGPILAILGGANMIVPRSILSKIIPIQELGKVNSFLGFIESISPLLAGPIYTLLYTQTFETFPGTFFLLSAILTIPPILSYSYFLTASTKDQKEKEK